MFHSENHRFGSAVRRCLLDDREMHIRVKASDVYRLKCLKK